MLSFVLSLLLAGVFFAHGDDGNGFDPHGGTRLSAARCGDDGPGIDPDGAPCSQSLFTDEGSGIDPNG